MGSELVDGIDGTLAEVALGLVEAGDWCTPTQRRATWIEVRDARTNPVDVARRAALSPEIAADYGKHAELAPAALECIHRIASDPGRLSRAWAERTIEALGVDTYVELIGVVATAMAIDVFDRAMGRPERELPPAGGGEPVRRRAEDVGDVGAWVPQSTGTTLANVSRALSLTPVQNELWVRVVQRLYSRGPEFNDLEWNRALSRPQVELVAARTTAELECFY